MPSQPVWLYQGDKQKLWKTKTGNCENTISTAETQKEIKN